MAGFYRIWKLGEGKLSSGGGGLVRVRVGGRSEKCSEEPGLWDKSQRPACTLVC